MSSLNQDSQKVLISAIGTMTSAAIVKALRKDETLTLIGLNSLSRFETATAKDVDEFYQVPSVLEDVDGYVAFILDFCKNHKIDYYYASIDEEVCAISYKRPLFEAIGVTLCVPNFEAVNLCHYKNKFSKFIDLNFPDIAIKTFDDISECSDDDFPLFIKPVEGRASIGCVRVADFYEMQECIKRSEYKSGYVIQQFVSGENITVDLARNSLTGQVVLLARRELLRNKNGCGIAVETFEDERLTGICESIAAKISLNGVVNIEFFKTDSGYKIVEINPRFSAGTDYSVLSGFDSVHIAMQIANGCSRRFEIDKIIVGSHFVKCYETYYVD